VQRFAQVPAVQVEADHEAGCLARCRCIRAH
jgi:hypothetical protein